MHESQDPQLSLLGKELILLNICYPSTSWQLMLNRRRAASEEPTEMCCRKVSQIPQNESIFKASTLTCSTCKMSSCPVEKEMAIDERR